MKDNKFANNLISLRKKFKLSQEELGLKINVSKQTISKYEKGIAQPNFHTLIEISKSFDCSLDELVFGVVQIKNKNPIELQIIIDTKIERFKGELSKSINNYFEYDSKSDLEFSKELTFDIDNKTKSLLKPVDTYNNIVNIHNIKSNGTVGVSFCGNISAGCPRPTFSDLNDIFYIPSHLLENNQEYFVLKINGESMNKIYQHNDYVLVKKYNHITNCFKVPFVVSVDGSESTVKFIDIDTNSHTFSLVPYSTDESFKVQTYSFDKHKLEILGSIECIINIKED